MTHQLFSTELWGQNGLDDSETKAEGPIQKLTRFTNYRVSRIRNYRFSGWSGVGWVVLTFLRARRVPSLGIHGRIRR